MHLRFMNVILLYGDHRHVIMKASTEAWQEKTFVKPRRALPSSVMLRGVQWRLVTSVRGNPSTNLHLLFTPKREDITGNAA